MSKLATVAAWALTPAMLVAMILVSGTTNLMGDFRAFYCAGSVVAQGRNPYLEEPLHACEQLAQPPARPATLVSVTLPAPLPPGVLVLLVPLSRLPFPYAAAVYLALLIAAMSAAVVIFARVTGASSVLLNLAFAGITATDTYYLGQPVPFAILALAGAAILVRGGRWVAASACAMMVSIEPHLALPALLAMFFAFPRTRIPIVAFAALLGAAGVAALGLPISIMYLREVIPAHALANAYEWQFSLTSILTSCGVDAAIAVRFGEAMYAVMVTLGITVAYKMWRATGDRAAIVLIPPAFAVFGGVHVHSQQMVIAFPAILYVYARFPYLRNLAATGLTFAMIPWNVFSASLMTGFTPFLVGWFGRATMGARRGLVLTGIAAVIAVSVLLLALTGFGPGVTHFVPRSYPPNALAEESWGAFSRAILARPSLLLQWLRLPILTGLAMGLVAIARAAFDAPQPSRIDLRVPVETALQA